MGKKEQQQRNTTARKNPQVRYVAQRIQRMSAPVTTGVTNPQDKNEKQMMQEKDIEDQQISKNKKQNFNSQPIIQSQNSFIRKLVPQKIARMTAPVTTGIIKPKKQLVVQRIYRMSAPVTTGKSKRNFNDSNQEQLFETLQNSKKQLQSSNQKNQQTPNTQPAAKNFPKTPPPSTTQTKTYTENQLNYLYHTGNINPFYYYKNYKGRRY